MWAVPGSIQKRDNSLSLRMLRLRKGSFFPCILAIVTLLQLCWSAHVLSQSPSPGCGTTAVYKSAYFNAVSSKELQVAYETYVQNSLHKSSSAKYTIPVVVHVVHLGGPENISDSQIRSQITALNNDFRRIPGTKGYASGVDTEIEFALAQYDPGGNITTGITRDSSALSNVYYAAADSTFFANDSIMKTTFGWPPDEYLNVWIVSQIDNGNILGYAFYPPYMAGSIWAGTYSYDGIVIAHEYWGTEGTAYPGLDIGATGTHEVGHWLGLFHPFEITEDTLPDGCACTDCITCADRVCDTPPTFDPNYGFPGRRNSCSNDSPDVPDQVRNYMDYADDAHMDMYTQGQKTRMHFFLENDTFRMKLHTQANQQATGVGDYGPLRAGFSASRREINAGATIEFTSHELNAATAYSWMFPGGNPLSSTDPKPLVTYDNPGVYSAWLRVDNIGYADTLTKTGYIRVVDTVASLPFSENFEGSAFPPEGWRILDPDSGGVDDYTWEQSTMVGAFGQSGKSASLLHFLYHIPDQKDGLVLPALDLTGMQSAEMVFSVAYEPNDSAFWLDTLSVLISVDLGTTWTEVWRKGGEDLATYNLKGSFFIPDSTEWRIDSADLSQAAGNIALIKFEALNGYGNNLFLDDVSIEGIPLGVEEELAGSGRFKVYPNPFSTWATVQIDHQWHAGEEMHLKIYDILGKLIETYPLSRNTNVLKINSQDIGTGIFILQLGTATELLDFSRIAIVK